MSVEWTKSIVELMGMFEQRGLSSPRWPERSAPQRRRLGAWDIIDASVMLQNMTELSYQLPSNTTLVEVLGPVGYSNMTSAGSMCYASLDPRPEWWRNGTFPLSASEKMVNGTNRTMFLMPVDPATRATVRVGGLGMDSTCFISGIKAYPFHL